MNLAALRRLVARGEAGPAGTSDRLRAQQLSGLHLGILGLKLGGNASQRQTLTASNVYDALNQSTRNVIKSIGESSALL